MSSIIVDFDDLENVTADVILADDSLEIVPEGLKVADPLLELIENTVGVASSIVYDYTWSGTFEDENGVLFDIGTNFGGTWSHPSINGVAVIRSSSIEGNNNDLVNRVLESNSTDNAAGEWVVVDIGEGRTLELWDYLIQNGASDGLAAPYNWKFQGSNDVETNDAAGVNAANWVDIDTQTNSTAIAQTVGDWGQFNPDFTSAPFRWFRVLANGLNRAGSNHLKISELEFFGRLTRGTPISDGALAAFQDESTLKALGDTGSTPTTPGTPAGYLKFSVDGADAWLPYYQ